MLDVKGKNPTKPEGEYFALAMELAVHPLWDYCKTVAPEITSRVRYVHSNDGDAMRNSIPNERCDKHCGGFEILVKGERK